MAGWCFRRGRDKATARERGFSEQWKKDLKAASCRRPSSQGSGTHKKPTYLFSERSEQTISDRREPAIYCLSATTGNASRRIGRRSLHPPWPDAVSRPSVTLPGPRRTGQHGEMARRVALGKSGDMSPHSTPEERSDECGSATCL